MTLLLYWATVALRKVLAALARLSQRIRGSSLPPSNAGTLLGSLQGGLLVLQFNMFVERLFPTRTRGCATVSHTANKRNVKPYDPPGSVRATLLVKDLLFLVQWVYKLACSRELNRHNLGKLRL